MLSRNLALQRHLTLMTLVEGPLEEEVYQHKCSRQDPPQKGGRKPKQTHNLTQLDIQNLLSLHNRMIKSFCVSMTYLLNLHLLKCTISWPRASGARNCPLVPVQYAIRAVAAGHKLGHPEPVTLHTQLLVMLRAAEATSEQDGLNLCSLAYFTWDLAGKNLDGLTYPQSLSRCQGARPFGNLGVPLGRTE